MRQRILLRQPDMNNIELQHRLDSAEMERRIAHRLQQCIVVDGRGTIEEVFEKIQDIVKKL